MTYSKSITEDDLQAYVDNELNSTRRAEVEEHLSNHPELLDEINEYKKINSDLKSLFEPIFEETIPEELLITQPAKDKKIFFSIAQVASILVAVTVGIVIGWTSHSETKLSTPTYLQSTQVLVNDAFAYHAVYTPEIKHPVEVPATQEQHLVKWLSKRLSTKVQAPMLTEVGYSLLGGRLLTTNNEPAAQFMYENTMGQRLTLLTRQRENNESESAFRYASKNGVNGFYWIDQRLSFVLLADIPKGDIYQIAHTVYEDLNR